MIKTHHLIFFSRAIKTAIMATIAIMIYEFIKENEIKYVVKDEYKYIYWFDRVLKLLAIFTLELLFLYFFYYYFKIKI